MIFRKAIGEKIPLRYNEKKIQCKIYDQIYTVNTLKDLLTAVYKHRHEGQPVCGDLKPLFQLHDKITGHCNLTKLHIRVEDRTRLQNQYIHLYDIGRDRYDMDNYKVPVMHKSSNIPYNINHNEFKNYMEANLNAPWIQLEYPYETTTKKPRTVTLLKYNLNLYQLNKERRDNLPESREARLRCYTWL